MTVRTIDLGAAGKDAFEIEDTLGDLGTGLGGNAVRESLTLSLDVLSRNLDAAMRVLADVIIRPDFPAAEIDREKNRQVDSLLQQMNDPSAVAARVRSILAFGRSHPYGKPASGTAESIESIDRSDIVRFHREFVIPRESALIFAGDIDLAEAQALAEKHFGAWVNEGLGAPPIPAVAPMRGGELFLVDKPGTPQTVVAQLLAGPLRSIDDYAAFRLLDAIWGGGGFGTRLNLNLREDKGYSYGVFSNVAMFREAGLWWAQASVQTDKTAESLLEFIKELRALAGERPVSQQELQSARETRTRGFSQSFESLSRVASQLADLWVLGLPATELQREYDDTTSVSLEHALAAARKYVDPSRATLLLVGDASIIEEQLEKIGFNPIKIDSEAQSLVASS